jgi:uncharacterized protein (TIGR02996 family)
VSRDPTVLLENARTALARQDYGVARDLLIDAWRSRRSPATANLVDIVEAHAPDALTSRLAAVITPRVATSHKNLRALEGIHDPRISRFAIDALVRLPFTARSAFTFLADLITIVEALGDTRIIPHVETIATGLDTRLNLLGIRQSLVAQLRRVVTAMKPPPPLPIEDTLTKLVEPLRTTTRSADALLAEVYANPDDDGPRIVLADLLLEDGDPRGELITLQIEGGDDEREKALLKKHGKQWLGALAPVLSWGRGYSHTRFRRGFVAVADIILSVGKKLGPIRADPAWATVEELQGSWDLELLLHAPLTALRTIERSLDAEDIARLAVRPLANVRQVWLARPPEIDPGALRAAFPKLETIAAHRHAPGSDNLEQFARFGVERLAITNNWFTGEAAPAIAAFERYVESLVGAVAPVAYLALDAPRGDAVHLRRDAHGRFERV